MATERPRYTVSVDKDLFEKIENSGSRIDFRADPRQLSSLSDWG